MKRIIPIIILLVCASLTSVLAQISDADRDKITSQLKASQTELLSAVKGLSEEQWLYKPTADSWSIAECVEHMAISEKNIFAIVGMSMQSEPEAGIKDKLKFDDNMIMGFITSREQKVKTRPEFEPSQKFDGYKGSLKAFKDKRKSNLQYVKTTSDDLRNHYFEFPFGWVDSYQVIVFMSGHTQRHIAQIEEVKAANGYPL